MLFRTLFTTAFALLLFFSPVAAEEKEKLPAVRFEISGENIHHKNTIVRIRLPHHVNAWRPLQLIDNETEEQVPVQISNCRDGKTNLLWFIVRDELPPHTSRHYELYYGNPVTESPLSLHVDASQIDIRQDGKNVLTYNHAHVIPPDHLSPQYIRSGYIHPVYSPSGLLVTEEFPDDHPHHKGVWFPWTRTEFEGRRINFWDLNRGEGTVQFAGVKALFSGSVFAGFRAHHEFIDFTYSDTGKKVMDEEWDVRLWNVDPSLYVWDLTSTQRMATEEPLKLLQHRYGGLGFRGAKEWTDDNHVILTSEGHTKADGHKELSRWVAHSGEIEEGREAAVIIMVHPQNERFPEPMRIWDTGGAFFCYSPIQREAWVIEPGRNYRFRYRFIIHDGPADAGFAEQMWQQFAHPVQVKILNE